MTGGQGAEGAKSHVERLSGNRLIDQAAGPWKLGFVAGGVGQLAEARRVYIVIADGIRYKRRHAGHKII